MKTVVCPTASRCRSRTPRSKWTWVWKKRAWISIRAKFPTTARSRTCSYRCNRDPLKLKTMIWAWYTRKTCICSNSTRPLAVRKRLKDSSTHAVAAHQPLWTKFQHRQQIGAEVELEAMSNNLRQHVKIARITLHIWKIKNRIWGLKVQTS